MPARDEGRPAAETPIQLNRKDEPLTTNALPTRLPVRCPRCNRLACMASAGAVVEVRCARCKHDFRWP